MLQTERKDKYLGMRLCFADYMQIIEAAQNAGVSISDFVLSILLPVINKTKIKTEVKDLVKEEANLKKSVDKTEPLIKTEQNIISSKLIPDNNTIEELVKKQNIYNQKLKAI